jgi:hypothetical protein
MNTTRVASARRVFLSGRPASPDEQAALEKSFFHSIATANGTHKTTAPARLRDVDELVCEQFTGAGTVHLLDVGISSGVTTLELLERLDRQGALVTGVGVDLCVRGVLGSFLGVDVLYDSSGRVLQLATPLFARGRPHPSLRSPRSRLLRLGMGVLESPFIRRRVASPRRSRPLDLVSRRLLERPHFEVVEHDIGLPRPGWEEAFDLIRAANVLNLDYFPPAQIAGMVRNLAGWLKPGGILAICRTNAADGANHGCLYRKWGGPGGLRRVRRFGGGYELDHLIDETPGSGQGR